MDAITTIILGKFDSIKLIINLFFLMIIPTDYVRESIHVLLICKSDG